MFEDETSYEASRKRRELERNLRLSEARALAAEEDVKRLRALGAAVVAHYDGYRARGVMPAPDEYQAMVGAINHLRAALSTKEPDNG